MLLVIMQSSFLQSPEWGAFQTQVGVRVKNFKNLQILEYPSLLGNFWYLPQAKLDQTELELVTNEAKKQNILFVRIELLAPIARLPKSAHLVKPRQPSATLVLNLKNSTEQLLAAMHQKTRYNIRLAEKKNLRVSWEKKSDIFIALMSETSARDKFGAHPTEYYQKMIAADMVEQGTVWLDNLPLASAIFIGYQNTYTYVHGASSNEHREVMAPYLLQWSAIVRAKNNGFEQYDFWGIAPEGVTNHPLLGVTRFKLGFGGERVNFGQALEIPIKPIKYMLFRILKKIRSL